MDYYTKQPRITKYTHNSLLCYTLPLRATTICITIVANAYFGGKEMSLPLTYFIRRPSKLNTDKKTQKEILQLPE